LFDLKYVAVETLFLLLSSITYGMAMMGTLKRNSAKVLIWLAITGLFGLGFIGMELNEFHHLIEEGNGPGRSAFLSAFFSLVGTHGIHVTSGLLWLSVLMYQVWTKGVTETNRTRLMCLSLFWHFLDIVWICVFTVVYLMGSPLIMANSQQFRNSTVDPASGTFGRRNAARYVGGTVAGESHASVKSYLIGFVLSSSSRPSRSGW
jgi:heme/copper-type cytochrome/quinol oxidase subunit 4